MNKIKLAIPNKGRIYNEIVRLLEKIGLEVPENGRKLYVNTNNPNIQIVYARVADIPLYVQSGVADIGIAGEDMIQESGAAVEKLLKLNFGSCKIAVAAPKNARGLRPLAQPPYATGLRVATKLVNISKRYFAERNKFIEVVRLAGAVELAPALGIADIIVDQVSTGTTLAENNLEIIEVLFTSDLYLIANKKNILDKGKEIDEVKISIESVITAEDKRYVMANVGSEDSLKKVISSVPSMDSPTILNLAKKGEYAIHTVIDSKELIPTIRKMKQAGAKDILVMNMSRVVE